MQSISHDNDISRRRDAQACRRALRVGSRTFFAASMFLPPRARASAVALYAFCRLADDAIDQSSDPGRALGELHVRLELLYSGQPFDHPADRAFADCVQRHDIPNSLPLALLDGFQWDAAGRRYQTIEDVCAYGVRVAGSVGIMMAMIMGVRDQKMLAGACDLGVAMQLTNIARDVGEDAARGRLYLPVSWFEEKHLEPEVWLRHPVYNSEIASIVGRLLAVADDLYARSDAAIRHLPATFRPGIAAARLLYSEIGREIARACHDSVRHRAVVPWQRKAAVLMAAALTAPAARLDYARDALPEAEYLLQTLALHATTAPTDGRTSWSGRVHWVLELFERLERRDLLLSRR